MLAIALALLVAQSTIDAIRPSVRAREEAIRRENWTHDAPPWAGTYTSGHGSLSIAATSGAVTSTESCMGPMVGGYDVVVDGRRLEFSSDEAPHRARVWWYVPWDGRDYLIPEFLLADFCARVNEGLEPRAEADGYGHLRASHVGKRVRGLPEVPAAWRSLLLTSPIESRVLRAWNRPARGVEVVEPRRRVMIDVGRANGVHPGLRLRVQPSRGRSLRVQAVEVTHGHSVLEIHDDDRRYADRIGVGDRVFAGRELPR